MFLRTLDLSGIKSCRVCRTHPELDKSYDLLERIVTFLKPDNDEGEESRNIYLTPEPECTEDDIIFVLNPSEAWGSIHHLDRMIRSNLVSRDEVLASKKMSKDKWLSYITQLGHRQDNRPSKKRKFLTDTWRITNLSKTGLLKFVPTIEKTHSHLTRDHKYGTTYAVDFFKRNPTLKKKAVWVLNRLADERSKRVYTDSLLEDPSKIWDNFFRRLTENEQYFDYIQLDENSVILNCGVEQGGEIPFFLSYGVRNILNVDPSGEERIHPYVRKWLDAYPGTNHFLEHAIWNKDEKVECSIFNGTGYSPQFVEGKTIETIIRENRAERLDLIKTDLEGIERHLIDDIIKAVERFRPQLAISIYHSADDLVDIPIQLINNCPDYNFYVENYSFESVEIILYGIPKERC